MQHILKALVKKFHRNTIVKDEDENQFLQCAWELLTGAEYVKMNINDKTTNSIKLTFEHQEMLQ